MDRGREIHGELSSADAHTGAAVQLYEAGGGTITLGSTEMLVVTDARLVSAAGGAVSVVAFNGSTTLTLFAGTLVANGGAVLALRTPFYCPRGGTLQLTAPAGQVNIQVEGCIIH